MAAEFGIDVHLDRVPLREGKDGAVGGDDLESQERMVAIARPQMLEAVEAVLDRWELHHAVIGEVTSSGELRAFWHGDVVGEIPARLLTDECPRYRVGQARRPAQPLREIVALPFTAEALLELLGSPALRDGSSSIAATTSSSARGPCAGRGSTPPFSGCDRRCGALPSRSTARVGSRGSTPSSAARSRCSRRRATSPVPAASRSASRTA